MLGPDRVLGASVLDLFAGSGALGLEAWSRGAAKITFVEKHRSGTASIRNNVKALCSPEDPLDIVVSDAGTFLRRTRNRYDIIFADPPYYDEWLAKMLDAMGGGEPAVKSRQALKAGGILIFEQHRSEPVEEVLENRPFELVKNKLYGTTRVLFLEQI